MQYHFRNLVFEGGGVGGIAYVGAMAVLEQKEILQHIDRVGGTSAGAINAVLLGLNYSIDETKEVVWGLDFNNFMDDSWGFVRDVKRLVEEFGWYRGDFFRDWIGKIIQAKTGDRNSTFADLHRQKSDKSFRDLYIIGTNLSTRLSEIFSHEHTPDVCVADAVRISMSIPLFFTAMRGHHGDVYVDGGVLRNYPVKLFDRERFVTRSGRRTEYYEERNRELVASADTEIRYIYNKETLGFRLDSAKETAVLRDHVEPEHQRIDDFFSYAWALVETVLEF